MSFLLSPYALVFFLLQIACAVHIVRTGRDYIWLWVVLFFSVAGCAVYVITQVLPGAGRSTPCARARKTAGKAAPIRRARSAASRHGWPWPTRSTTATALARECVKRGDYGNAARAVPLLPQGHVTRTIRRSCWKLAQTLFAQNDYAAARQTWRNWRSTIPASSRRSAPALRTGAGKPGRKRNWPCRNTPAWNQLFGRRSASPLRPAAQAQRPHRGSPRGAGDDADPLQGGAAVLSAQRAQLDRAGAARTWLTPVRYL